MILCNLALEIEPLLEPSFIEEAMEACIHEVMEVFLRPELSPDDAAPGAGNRRRFQR